MGSDDGQGALAVRERVPAARGGGRRHRHGLLPDKDGNVYALDVFTGALRWKSEGFGEFTTQPLVTRGSIYVGNSDGRLSRIDTYDGGRAWAANLGSPVTGQPTIVEGRMVVGLANGRIVGLQ